MKYSNILSAFYTEAWVITPAFHTLIEDILVNRASDAELSAEEVAQIQASIDQGHERRANRLMGMEVPEGVQVIGLHGPLISRATNFDRACAGVESPQKFAESVRFAADDPSVREIVVDGETPGGTVAGTSTAAEAVAYARSKKPITFVAESLLASAGYWIGSQASSIVVGSNGEIGSIGVIAKIRDTSARDERLGIKTTTLRTGKYKGAGSEGSPVDEDAIFALQERIDANFDQFIKAVATGRDLDANYVRENVADGRVFLGEKAVSLGLADEVGSLASVLESIKLKYQREAKMEQQLAEATAKITALETQLAEANSNAEKVLALNETMAGQLASFKSEADARASAAVEQRAIAVVDEQVIGKGKAAASERDTLLADCKDADGRYSDAQIKFVARMYDKVPENSVVPLGSVLKNEAPRGANSEDVVGKWLASRNTSIDAANENNPLLARNSGK